MSILFRYRFLHGFLKACLIENAPKMLPKSSVGTPPYGLLRHYFSQPFPNIDFYMHFGRVLATVYLPLAAFWLTFGGLWLTFWYPCRSIFSFLVAPGVILHILLYFRRKSYVESYFEKRNENPIDVWPNAPLPFFRKVVSAVAETRLCRAKDIWCTPIRCNT